MKKLGISLLAVLGLFSQPLYSQAADGADAMPSEQSATSSDAKTDVTSEQKADTAGLQTVVPNVPKPAPTPLELQVGGLEQKFFGEVFEKEPVSRRMDRLEKFAYGATTHGTNEERIDALRAAMSKPLPDGTKGAEPPLMAAPTPPPAAAEPPATASAIPQAVSQAAPQATRQSSATDSLAAAPPPAAQSTDAVNNPAMLATTVGRPAPALQSGIQRNVPAQVEAAAQSLPATAVPHATPSAPLHLSLASLILKVDDPKRTMQALADTLDSDPVFSADLFYQKAQVELGMKDYKGALKDLTDAILKEPMRYKYYLARAVVHKKLGNPFMADKDVATARYTYRDLPDRVEFDADTKSIR